AGVLPAGGEILDSHYVPPADSVPMAWLARITLALGAGLLGAALAWLAVGFVKPRDQRSVPITGNDASVLWRLAWTPGGGVAFYLVGRFVTLPGINEVELAHVVTTGGLGWNTAALFSVFALGLNCVISTFIIVELATLALPLFGVKIRRNHPVTRRKIA